MATAKQLAALKKARAARKRNLANKADPKRKVSTKRKTVKKKVSVSAPSRATKKPPSKRLKRRRKANVKKGYYPNPAVKISTRVSGDEYCAQITSKDGRIGYVSKLSGLQFDTDKKKALCGTKQTAAEIVKAVRDQRLPQIAKVGLVKK